MVQEFARWYDSTHENFAGGIISALPCHLTRSGIPGARLLDAPEHSHVQGSPNNEGYDLICIHPDPMRQSGKHVRIQAKSRYATDCDRSFPVKERTFRAFDFLVAVFLNVGQFFRPGGAGERSDPEFYTLPLDFIRQHHNKTSSWEEVQLRGLPVEEYRNERGFELIAKELEIPYPSRDRSDA